MKRKLMYTDSKGISYYQKGNRYFSNTGWLEREITKEEYEKHTKNPLMDLFSQLMEAI